MAGCWKVASVVSRAAPVGVTISPWAGVGRSGAPAEPVAAGRLAAPAPDAGDVRRAAARSLGRLGSDVHPLLTDALAAPDAQVRRGAAEALGWIGAEALPALTAALKNDDAAVRRASARSLGRWGPAARPAEAALVEALRDADPAVRDAAAEALRRIRIDLPEAP